MSARVEVRVRAALPGFVLDATWEASDPVVALFGPSGAGKTLTLQCLAGLVRPDAGRIAVDGRVFFDSRRRHVPPQAGGSATCSRATRCSRTCPSPRTWVRPRPLAGAERRRRVAEVLERLGLAARWPIGARASCPAASSSGWRWAARWPWTPRCCCSTSRSPRSTGRSAAVRAELGRIVRDWGTPAVLVTHDLAEAFELADRIVVYDGGRIIQSAPKSECCGARPPGRSRGSWACATSSPAPR